MPLVGFLQATVCSRAGERGFWVRRVGARFSSHRSGPGNWKSEKLTVCSPIQISRISDFQNFRFSPLHLLPENLGGEFRVGVGGYPENAQARTFGVIKQSVNVLNEPQTCRSRYSWLLPECTVVGPSCLGGDWQSPGPVRD